VNGRDRSELRAGDSFGEIAILYGRPRTATVIATQHLTLLAVPGRVLRDALRDRPEAEGTLVSDG
jgi:CRP-like cAMP-binding protein